MSAERDFGGYRVLRELEPLGDVRRLLAFDPGLNIQVEIHALAPDGVTPSRVAAFRQRAGLLARLTDPGIAPVHRIEEGGPGGLYCVVHRFEESSLADRLAAGPLRRAEAVRLADDLLPGLVAAHRAGVVGGELDPRTIVGHNGGWVATGLLIERSVPGSRWVAPEEHGGGKPGPAADVFVAGRVLREAFGSPPRKVARVLERATASSAADRWPDAARFRQACRRATRRRRWKRPAQTAGAMATLLLGLFQWHTGGWPFGRSQPPEYRLAVVPFVSGTNEPGSIARDLAGAIQLNLDGVPGLRIASARWVLRRLPAEVPDPVDRALVSRLRAEWVAYGRVDRQDQSLRVNLTLYDADAHTRLLPEVRGSVGDLASLGDSLARQVLAAVAPDRIARYVPRPELEGVPFEALKAFFRGEEAFGRDEYARADRFYSDALSIDSTFALAAWRLANVRRWRRLPVRVDLRALYQRDSAGLGETDRRLLEALIEPDLLRRFAMLDTVAAKHPEDAYAQLIDGEELWHRGPLVGYDLTPALQMMRSATAADSALSQAYDHIIMYYIRTGDEAAASRAFAQKSRMTFHSSPDDLNKRRLFRLALYERFHPWMARLAHARLRFGRDPADAAALARVARLATPWFDIPVAQVRLNDILLSIGPAGDSAHGSARVGMALGLFAQGQVTRGFAELDRAARELGSAEMRLQQAEWRLLPGALGLRGWYSGDAQPWLARLDTLGADPVLGPRARWALALVHASTGDSTALARQDTDPAGGGPFGLLLRAVRAGLGRRYDEAVAIADSARRFVDVTEPPDPFAPAALHLFSGEWERQRGHLPEAEGDWRWYLAADVEGWPSGPPQSGEVDGVLGVLGRRWGAELKLAGATGTADTVDACATMHRIAELWRDADSSLAWVARGIPGLEEGCRR